MSRHFKAILVATVAVICLVSSFAPASAQSPPIATGVVTDVETNDGGELTAFSIVIGNGTVIRFTVSPETEFGLENRVGDRWVSDQGSEPKEAATRLKDQQNRLAQISVQADGSGTATSVVQAVSTEVGTNLGYLFAVVAIAWVSIMAYVVYIGVRQRTIASELARHNDDNQKDEV